MLETERPKPDVRTNVNKWIDQTRLHTPKSSLTTHSQLLFLFSTFSSIVFCFTFYFRIQ